MTGAEPRDFQQPRPTLASAAGGNCHVRTTNEQITEALRPRLIGVANGVGTGIGTGLAPGAVALQGNGLGITPTRLYIQSPGDDALVADLRILEPAFPLEAKDHVRTPALPEIDGAPGGTLEGFGILTDVLAELPSLLAGATAHVRSHCFVPSVSAVAIRDLDTDEDLYATIDELLAADSELHEFKCAAQNEEHTKITEELCTWIFDRLP